MQNLFLNSPTNTSKFLKISVIKCLLSFLMILSISACETSAIETENEQIPTTTQGYAEHIFNSIDVEPRELKILTHDSFDISEKIIKEFETAYNAKITIFKAGSSGAALSRAILEKSNPSADILHGIDNTFLTKAINENIFIEHKSPWLKNVDPRFLMDDSYHVTPISYGYVIINYDRQHLADLGLNPPDSLKQLTEPDWKGKLVIQNPATSSPGLAFLLVTIAEFGDSSTSEYSYTDYWEDLKSNDVLIKDGWSDSYYTDFSLYGGDRPLVVSYATSPAAEVYFSEGKYTEPPTENLFIDGASFLQIEGAGILKGSTNQELAKLFINFMLQRTFQEDIPTRMFVYPVNKFAEKPEFFRFAEVPTLPAKISPQAIEESRETWIKTWTDILLR